MAGPQRAERLRVLSCGRRPHYFSTRLLGQVIVLTPAWPSHAQVVVRLLACALTIGGRAVTRGSVAAGAARQYAPAALFRLQWAAGQVIVSRQGDSCGRRARARTRWGTASRGK